ncbi:hypothetical protein MMPV_004868 [Pyropia vietnamensis]
MQRSRLCDVASAGVLLTGTSVVPVGMLAVGRFDPFTPDAAITRGIFLALTGTAWALLLGSAVPLAVRFLRSSSVAKASDTASSGSGGSSTRSSSSAARSRTHLTSTTAAEFRAIAVAAAVAVAGLVTLGVATGVWLGAIFRTAWAAEAVYGIFTVLAVVAATAAAGRTYVDARTWARLVEAREGLRGGGGSTQDLEDRAGAEGEG